MKIELPGYARTTIILVGMFVLVWMLSITRQIIVPILFAAIFAILLTPFVNFLVRHKWNRIVAISLVVLLACGLMLGLAYLLVGQMVQFGKSVPAIIENFDVLVADAEMWFSQKFDVSPEVIDSWLNEKGSQMVDNAGSNMGRTLATTGSLLVYVVLIPVYVFMILFYQPMLIEFIFRLFDDGKEKAVSKVIVQAKVVIQSYLVGLLFEAIIVTILYAIALFSLGIEYALLLALIGAILNLIPYLGSILAAALPMVLALSSSQPSKALLVLGAYVLIQFIDNNYIVPRVVASKVRINALVSIVVVIAGGMLWGIPGMFLAIPTAAILKVIFDHIEGADHWGYLLGDEMPETERKLFVKKPKVKKPVPVKIPEGK